MVFSKKPKTSGLQADMNSDILNMPGELWSDNKRLKSIVEQQNKELADLYEECEALTERLEIESPGTMTPGVENRNPV